MKRREFFSWLGGIGAAGMAAGNLKGITLPMPPKHEDTIMMEEDPNPHDFIDTSYHFRNNLEWRLFRALMLNHCRLYSCEERMHVASVMTPIVGRYMQAWRDRTGIHPRLGLGDDITSHVPITVTAIRNITDNCQRMVMVAEDIGDAVIVLKKREQSSPQGGRNLMSIVKNDDWPDYRMVNFDVTTCPVEGTHGR